MKFLVDECLTTRLVNVANEAGFEAHHVAWLGMAGAMDWVIANYAEEHDCILVTRNGVDFRGPASTPGESGLYAGVSFHAGLVCINGPDELDGPLQVELFRIALDTIAELTDLTNTVVDVTLADINDDHVSVSVYPVPKDGPTADLIPVIKKTVEFEHLLNEILAGAKFDLPKSK